MNFTRDVITHPLQRAFKDSELEKKLREACEDAFDVGTAVDRYAGNVNLPACRRPTSVHSRCWCSRRRLSRITRRNADPLSSREMACAATWGCSPPPPPLSSFLPSSFPSPPPFSLLPLSLLSPPLPHHSLSPLPHLPPPLSPIFFLFSSFSPLHLSPSSIPSSSMCWQGTTKSRLLTSRRHFFTRRKRDCSHKRSPKELVLRSSSSSPATHSTDIVQGTPRLRRARDYCSE